MTGELKVCPHCGGKAIVIRPHHGGKPYAMCTINYCTAPKDTVEEVVEAYNRRIGDD